MTPGLISMNLSLRWDFRFEYGSPNPKPGTLDHAPSTVNPKPLSCQKPSTLAEALQNPHGTHVTEDFR